MGTVEALEAIGDGMRAGQAGAIGILVLGCVSTATHLTEQIGCIPGKASRAESAHEASCTDVALDAGGIRHITSLAGSRIQSIVFSVTYGAVATRTAATTVRNTRGAQFTAGI